MDSDSSRDSLNLKIAQLDITKINLLDGKHAFFYLYQN